jgi:glycosyltransferase involved in cell wall biosynthesis
MYSVQTTAQKPLIHFFKLARFSNTNAQVEAQLRRHFPEADLEVTDLKRVFERPSAALLRALPAAAFSLGMERVRGRAGTQALSAAAVNELLRMPVMFSAMSRAAQRAVARERSRVWFTIQTQSLWNAAVPGIANFVYTDSTLLANLYFERGDFRWMRPAAWLERERRIYADAAATFVMSEHVRRSLTELYGIDPAKVAQVGVGANVQPAASPLPAPRDNKTILFVGMEWERKGGPELIEAFRRLPPRHADARLLIVGTSPAIEVPRCEVIGRVPQKAVADYYRQAAIFCMPTRLEPFGIAFIEAMQHALAVAAPRHGAMLDYIKEQETGVLHQPGNLEDIVRALTWLLDHPLERQAIAARGLETVRSRYTWEAVGRRLKAEILSSLGRCGLERPGTFGSGPRLLPHRAG